LSYRRPSIHPRTEVRGTLPWRVIRYDFLYLILL
ncbi:unnamed protein product, partial [marine sediment metagenome]